MLTAKSPHSKLTLFALLIKSYIFTYNAFGGCPLELLSPTAIFYSTTKPYSLLPST